MIQPLQRPSAHSGEHARTVWWSLAWAFLFAAFSSAALLSRAVAVELDIFDDGIFAEGEVEIVNGRIIVKESPAKAEEKLEADPAGDQILELTDGSQLHGELVALSR